MPPRIPRPFNLKTITVRTYSLTELHQRAIKTLELIGEGNSRLIGHASQMHQAIHYWKDMKKVDKIKTARAITEAAISRLTLHYARIIERINQVLTKSLQSA